MYSRLRFDVSSDPGEGERGRLERPASGKELVLHGIMISQRQSPSRYLLGWLLPPVHLAVCPLVPSRTSSRRPASFARLPAPPSRLQILLALFLSAARQVYPRTS